TSIGDFALAYNRTVESVTIPEGITSLGNSAFEMCEKLSAVSLPEGIETIGSFCFNLCKKLQTVHLQEGLVSMGTLAFYQCENLTTVTLPSTLVTIDDNAFDGCTALAELTNYNPVPQDIAAKNVFNKLNVASVTLRVPQGSLSAYQNAPVWQDFKIVEFNPHEGIEEVQREPSGQYKGTKVIKDGQLFIERNGKTYNALGTEIQ
ncbi:MAG: leucine-rich repeat domain-containing protein, partial [Paludibacteraceae bacterium]|nr:leucine-rich repeat domain-containing protein [Paludibacteraceae bacterium]